jgi:sugar/nucleoside kinase (ribokinase family)
VPAVHDTTGAGDAFAAGFLGSLVAGAAPVDAARAGHRAAAAAIATVSNLEP